MGNDLSPEDKLEQLLNSKIEKQFGSKINAKPMDKNEIIELYKKEDCMCLINFETDEGGKKNNNGFGSGFFCNLKNSYFPFQKALFTNNHVLNKESLRPGEKIKLIYKQNPIIIEMTQKRNRFTNDKLDYTCIEILDEDEISNFFDIDTSVINNKSSLEGEEIFILQFNETKNLLFSSGKILYIQNNIMVHSAVTNRGSSGSPLIRRNRNELNYIVGIHFGTLKDYKNYNLATSFDNILNDLKNKIIEVSQIKIVAHIRIPESNYKARIICSCENAEKDYELKLDNSIIKNEEEIKKCLIFINKQKIDFSYYYTFRYSGDYEIIYIFHNLLNATNLMFYKCKDLIYLDLSNFNTENVTNMNRMFNSCLELRRINLKNLNTEKVTDMSWIFNECTSLRDLDLSSFKTDKVQNMEKMFNRCESLVNLNISTFNTENVAFMISMFWKCRSLKKLDLSNFNTGKVKSMSGMFCNCHSLKLLDVSNFNTENVTNMVEMFYNCKSLENLDLKSFNIRNVKEMLGIFADCESLTKIDLSNFDTRHLDEINWLFSGCKNLKKNNVITKDERILKTFN
jgi:surface protein